MINFSQFHPLVRLPNRFCFQQQQQQKTTKHIKKHESITYLNEENKSMESPSNGVQMMGFLNRDIKTAVLKMLREIKEDVDKNRKTVH